MRLRGWNSTAVYVGLLTLALLVSWQVSPILGFSIDNSIYDFFFRVYPIKPWPKQSALLAIDERTLNLQGGPSAYREMLARALPLLNSVHPKVVVVDVELPSRSDPAVDSKLAAVFRQTPNLVLSAELLRDGFEDPIPEFKQAAAAIGHVHALPDKDDAVTRAISLEKTYHERRLWALSLEAFRLSRGVKQIVEHYPYGIEVGDTFIPVAYDGDGRTMRVRFAPAYSPIPSVSLQSLLEDPSKAAVFAGKVAFVGVTAAISHDTLNTPYTYGGTPTAGVEIHAAAFETMASKLFITDARLWLVFSVALLIVATAGLAFRYLPAPGAYLVSVALIAAAFYLPYLFFQHQLVFPFSTSASAAVLGTMTAAGYYHLVVRKSLRRSEAEKTRYQQAMHFAIHEMRTPLSTIQGSSELMTRYALNEEKRKQIASMINSESKRLAHMVEIFLNVERLSAGQMELKQEPIPVKQLVEICVERTRPLAERKHIGIVLEQVADELQLTGDRELMEYACYNLLTNAVKYSPQQTEVTVSGRKEGGHIRIAVKDQGIGMDQKEVKQIFQKFYRTKKAEESGEAGTGIGLSIVQQIVEQHGGEIEVISQPGVGSCFTLAIPAAAAAAPVPTVAERR